MKRWGTQGAVLAVAFACGWTASAAYARRGESEHLVLGKPARHEVLLEREGYVCLYDELRRNPVWEVYHLLPAYLGGAGIERPSFLVDRDLPAGSRASNADYNGSAFDKGHMVPWADQRRSDGTRREAMLLSNVVPQDRVLNRGLWGRLEDRVRTWAGESDEAYVFVGPIPSPDAGAIGERRVTVPKAMFKVVAVRRAERWHTIAFVVPNAEPSMEEPEMVRSIAEVERLTGFSFLDLMPGKRELESRTPADLEEWLE
jgi:endonuclease G